MQNSVIRTRCFCHYNSNFPDISIKTEKIAGSWAIIDDNSEKHESYKIFPCGHAIHERCSKIMARLNQEFQETVACPMCTIDWTRPHEIHLLEAAENDNPHVKYNDCLCKERIRVFKANSNEWIPTKKSFKAYPCGHGCHVKCHQIYWKILNTTTDSCPLCAPALEERRVIHLEHQVAELLSKLRQQNEREKKSAAERKIELANWNEKKAFIAVAVLVTSACLLRFGHFVTDLKTPIPLTKFTLGELAAGIIALAFCILTTRLLTRPN